MQRHGTNVCLSWSIMSIKEYDPLAILSLTLSLSLSLPPRMPFFNLLLTMNRHQYMQLDLLKGQEFVVHCHFNSLNMECVSKDHGNSKCFIWFAFSSLRSHVNTSKLTTKKNWKENLVLFFSSVLLIDNSNLVLRENFVSILKNWEGHTITRKLINTNKKNHKKILSKYILHDLYIKKNYPYIYW
jgi:hypothetical protein